MGHCPLRYLRYALEASNSILLITLKNDRASASDDASSLEFNVILVTCSPSPFILSVSAREHHSYSRYMLRISPQIQKDFTGVSAE
jgi:hypothetical protein